MKQAPNNLGLYITRLTHGGKLTNGVTAEKVLHFQHFFLYAYPMEDYASQVTPGRLRRTRELTVMRFLLSSGMTLGSHRECAA